MSSRPGSSTWKREVVLMAFCAKCGKDMQEAKFCPSCGAPATPASVPKAPPPAAGMAPPAPAQPAPYQQAAPTPPGVPPAPAPGTGIAPPVIPPRGSRAKPRSKSAMIFGAVGVVAMVVVAIGSALPWATASSEVFSVSANGLSGDGVITIIVGFLALAFFVVGIIGRARWPFITSLVLSLIISAVAIYDTVDVAGKVTVGAGLILCLIAGVIGVVAAVGGIASPRQTN